jgi:type II secretory pathway component PulL
MKKLLCALCVLLFISACATKGGWPCWSFQKNTDQKNEAAGRQYLSTNAPPTAPAPNAK